jgi:hypothetical protein
MKAKEAIGAPVAALSKAAARWRGQRRALHPNGCVFRARLDIDESDPRTEGILPTGSHEAVVRLSRGGGLPSWLPDILGLAVKFRPPGGTETDLLLASSAPGPLGKFVLLPARRFFDRPYSSIVRFQNGPHQLLLGALPPEGRGPTLDELRSGDGGTGATFGVAVASPTGHWRRVGSLTLVEACPDDEELEFEPWNLPAGARPRGFLNWLRTRSYPASQEARTED